MERAILLADMNSFFASVHQVLDPGLRGRPVAIIGDPEQRHGIVLSASYEAKDSGVKTGMVLREARQLSPHCVFIKSQHQLYVKFSNRIIEVMRDYTPLVEPVSIDEAFLDVTGSQKLFGPPIEIARQLKRRIRQDLGLTCSVGVAPNKLLAKMASDLQKPDGLTVLNRQDVAALLWPLPVRELFGVGPRYEQHLRRLNIFTIGDLARYPVAVLKHRFGASGEDMWLSANGVDDSPVDADSLNQAKSIGHQFTLPSDCKGEGLKSVILELADLVAYRVRNGRYVGRTVVLYLKDPGFKWLSRTQMLPEFTDLAADIARTALNLLAEHWHPDWPVRMVGVSLANLVKHRIEQLDLFGDKEKQRKVELACDQVRKRFGKAAVLRAASLASSPKSRQDR